MTRRKLSTSPQSPSTSSSDVSPSILITVSILAVAVILSASIYLLLRFLRRNSHPTPATRTTTTTSVVLPHSLSNSSEKSLRQVSPVIDALPLFTYDRLTSHNGGDCAVCLSKFETNDVLRLLPICCHAFHAECIDTWLSANHTCPLCRSPIFLSESDIIGKLTGERSGSFRVEIGNVSNRGGNTTAANSAVTSGEIRRSYSLGGSFDYIIAGDDDAIITDIPSTTDYHKESMGYTAEQQAALAAEVGTTGGGGGSWLKDYLSFSVSSSRTASFRGSGRWFFTGSSRRSNNAIDYPVGIELDEASRLGNEIGELFRWLSGD